MIRASGTSERVAGTIVRILHPGGDGKPWRALLDCEDERVVLKVDFAPQGLEQGDDLHCRGTRHPAGRSNGGDIPDEIAVRSDDAEARLSLLANAANVVVETSWSPADSRKAVNLPGLATMEAAAKAGLARTTRTRGLASISRSRETPDADLSWAVDRFSDSEIAEKRDTAVLAADPTALVARRGNPTALFDRLDAIFEAYSSIFEHADADAAEAFARRNVPTEDEQKTSGTDRRAELDAKIDEAIRKWGSEARNSNEQKSAIVVSHSSFPTWTETWSRITGLPPFFTPRANVAPETHARITAAYELAHAHQGAFGFGAPDRTDIDDANLDFAVRANCFADATALMLYVCDTGDVDAARAIADARCLAPLGGFQTHATGSACLEAIRQGVNMRRATAGKQVSISEIMEAAAAIAATRYAPVDDVYEVYHALGAKWMEQSPSGIAESVRMALAETPIDDRDRTNAVFAAAVDALRRTAFTPFDMKSSRVRHEAVGVEREALATTASRLRSLGFGATVPTLLAAFDRRVAEADDHLEGRTTKMAKRMSGGGNAELYPSEEILENERLVNATSLVRFAKKADRKLSTVLPGFVGNVEGYLMRLNAARCKMLSGQSSAQAMSKASSTPRRVAAQSSSERRGRSAFDMGVDERIRILAKLAVRDVELRLSGPELLVRDLPALAKSVNDGVSRMTTLAWSLRADYDTWSQIRSLLDREDTSEIERRCIRALVGKDGASLALPLSSAEISLLESNAAILERLVRPRGALDVARHLQWRSGEPGGKELAPLPSEVPVIPEFDAPTMRHAVIEGVKRLHCEDSFALEGADGRQLAFLEGHPAVIVTILRPDGSEATTRLMRADVVNPEEARVRFGPDACIQAPEERHFAAIRRAMATGSDEDLIYVANRQPVFASPTKTFGA